MSVTKVLNSLLDKIIFKRIPFIREKTRPFTLFTFLYLFFSYITRSQNTDYTSLTKPKGRKEQNLDLIKNNLHGPIKLVKEKSYNGWEKKLLLFDKNGNKYKEYEYYYEYYGNEKIKPKKILISKAFYKTGKLIAKHEYYVTGRLSQKKTYTYDEAGNLAKSTLYFPGSFPLSSGRSAIITYKNDERGNLLEERHYTNIFQKWFGKGQSTGSWKYAYRYDDQNNLIEESKYDTESQSCLLKTIYQFDYKNILNQKIINGDDEKIVYKYDNHKIIEERIERKNKDYSFIAINETIFTYNDDVLLDKKVYMVEEAKNQYGKDNSMVRIEFTPTKENTRLLSIVVKYDKKGNETEYTRYKYDNKNELTETTTQTYNYEYDKWGNWTKQFKDSKLFIEQEINYY